MILRRLEVSLQLAGLAVEIARRGRADEVEAAELALRILEQLTPDIDTESIDCARATLYAVDALSEAYDVCLRAPETNWSIKSWISRKWESFSSFLLLDDTKSRNKRSNRGLFISSVMDCESPSS